ncbi:MAG: hypothetical protein MUP47_09300 [Phycisphaerae bacterium]|nr:hypothetical protein [Phycisphaerae bacterium]
MNELVLREFRNPGTEYRSAPFWAWNGRMEPDELRRQVRLMHRMGMGGFFMHSRVGLVTPYLSEEWMDCVAACVDEAEKLDMKAWLYDEDRWPSGAAGGLVTKNPAYRERELEMLTFDRAADFRWRRGYLAAFVATLAPPRASGVRRLKRGERPGPIARGQKVLAFRVTLKPRSSWYNGYTYIDAMNPAAVREFLRVTHEAYRRRFGRQFGRRIPGIFTDEPTYGKRPGPNFLQWTDSLPRHFRRRYGYDVLDHLVELLFDVDGQTTSQPRWHYFDCITHLFVEAFSRQIGQWCQKHGLAFTGHTLGEGSLIAQTNVVGSCLRFYEHMQAPGMDILTEYNREYDTAKQVSSAARQFGRRWRVSETYGCTGWDFPFAGHKAVGDWQAALGINLRCQHLSWYTMEGEAKRDYPAAISYQSPWWQAYTKVEDYFARVHVLMSRGREVRDLLVIHPVESAWTLQSIGNDGARQRFNDMAWKLRDALLVANIDFDWGDEDILARHGRIRRRGPQAVLTVGKADYTTVLVPPLRTIRSTTLALLRRFRRAGGTVVLVRPAPQYVDALPSRQAADLAAGGACAAGLAAAAAVEPTARRVSITDAKGRQIVPTLYCLREDDDALYLFVCNTGHNLFGRDVKDLAVRERRLAFDRVHITVAGSGGGAPLELDADTGEVFRADGAATRAGWTMATSLPALGSRLFLLPKKRLPKPPPRRKVLRTVRTTSLGGGRWDIQLSEPNCLVLDRPAYRINDGRWRALAEILKVDNAVRDAMGAPRRSKSMVQPWAQPKLKEPRRAKVELSYVFDVQALPTGALYLAVERPETFTVTVNGHRVNRDVECGWWVDRSLRKLPIDPAALRLGRNELTLVCDYSELHPGLEIVYLLGEFGTRVRGTHLALTAAPRRLALGDWVKQGLAFYSGSVGYTRTIQPRLSAGRRLFVHVPSYEGVAVRVLVDGQPAGTIAWEPNELDITDFVRGKRSAVLTVEVLGHRRNSHGPLHLNYRPRWFGPAEFHPRPDQEIAGYDLVACGLMRAPRLVVRK